MRASEQAKKPQLVDPGANPGSAARRNRVSSLAPIRERDEIIRSADPNMSNSRKMQAAAAAHKLMQPANQASGYNSNNNQDARRRDGRYA